MVRPAGHLYVFSEPAFTSFGLAEAKTTYGIIGVKVWVYKGEDYNQPRPLGRRRGA